MEINIENLTSNSKTVVIFGREHHAPLRPSTVDEAYQVLTISSHGRASFTYPKETSIGAFYKREDGEEIHMGPYPADAGSTWAVVCSSPSDCGSMIQDSEFSVNEIESIMIELLIFML